MEDRRRRAWEARAEWPLTILAVLFLATYALPILGPGLPLTLRSACSVVGWCVWAIFLADYAIRWSLSENRGRFVRSSLVDLLVLALPLLRPLRMLRLITLLDVLNRRASSSLRGRVAIYVAGAMALIVFCSALAILDAERKNPDANITDFGDAVWWAATTVTTVGYGDRFPITSTGRLIASLLMLGGIALLGIVTAGLASWLLDRIREVEAETQAATRRGVAYLAAEVEALREELRRLTSNGTAHPQASPPGVELPWLSSQRDG